LNRRCSIFNITHIIMHYDRCLLKNSFSEISFLLLNDSFNDCPIRPTEPVVVSAMMN
jgi:hypothetical protein